MYCLEYDYVSCFFKYWMLPIVHLSNDRST